MSDGWMRCRGGEAQSLISCAVEVESCETASSAAKTEMTTAVMQAVRFVARQSITNMRLRGSEIAGKSTPDVRRYPGHHVLAAGLLGCSPLQTLSTVSELPVTSCC